MHRVPRIPVATCPFDGPSMFSTSNLNTSSRCSAGTRSHRSATDCSACVPAPTERDRGAFKTPSLRNAERTWPYMHNGAISDGSPAAQTGQDGAPHLVRLVQFYNQGGGTPVVGRRDPILRPLNLTDAEIADLVEFLKALTDDTIGTHPEETSPPTVPDSPCPS